MKGETFFEKPRSTPSSAVPTEATPRSSAEACSSASYLPCRTAVRVVDGLDRRQPSVFVDPRPSRLAIPLATGRSFGKNNRR